MPALPTMWMLLTMSTSPTMSALPIVSTMSILSTMQRIHYPIWGLNEFLRSHKIFWDLVRYFEIQLFFLRSITFFWDLTRFHSSASLKTNFWSCYWCCMIDAEWPPHHLNRCLLKNIRQGKVAKFSLIFHESGNWRSDIIWGQNGRKWCKSQVIAWKKCHGPWSLSVKLKVEEIAV